MAKPSLSVIFLTLNEEFHIGEAIDNVKEIADEIFVLDSLSVDKTVDIALAKGAKVYQRKFTGFGDQWNAALTKLPIKTEWTMKMDPDERLSDALKAEIVASIENPGKFVAFDIIRSLYFMNRPLRMEMIPDTRVWRTGKGRFSDIIVNEHLLVDGEIRCLKERMTHLDCRDLHLWVDKQNRYTTMEALRRYRGENFVAKPKLFGSFLERRMWINQLYLKLPGRYLLIFLWYFFIKGMVFRGSLGFHYSILRTWCGRLIHQKILEMKTTGRETTLPVGRVGQYDLRCNRVE